jgi:hypothetical protein
MKHTYLILILLAITLNNCKDDVVEVTEIETVDFIPDPVPDYILIDYPDGVIFLNMENEEPIVIEDVSVRVTAKETLLYGVFKDPNSGASNFLIVGVKGFSEGDFKGNIISSSFFFGGSSMKIDQADISITQYGEVGEIISGVFSLKFELDGNEALLKGEFGALRIN